MSVTNAKVSDSHYRFHNRYGVKGLFLPFAILEQSVFRN